MAEQPLVSILMTVYNRASYIEEAIKSVLASSYLNWELLIVDDCSSDESFQIAKKYEKKDRRVAVYKNKKNLGQFPNRNYIATLASGKYIKFLDSDDLLYPHGLKVMVDSMESFPGSGIGIVFNNYLEDVPLPIKLESKEALTKHYFEMSLLSPGPTGIIYNREFFFKIGCFSDYGVASDYELSLRMASQYPVVLFNRDLIWWRQHEGQEINLLKKDYQIQNRRILYNTVNAPFFPLEEKVKRAIIINHQKNQARKIIKDLLQLRFARSVWLMKIEKLKLPSFLYALMPRQIRQWFY